MDGLEADLDNLKSINQIVTEYKCEGCRYKKIPVLVIRPSRDLSELAMDFESSIPTFVRYLTLGLGPIQQTAEMISYLLFESEFCNALIELGYNDAMNQSHEISSFLSLKIQGEPDADILKPSPP
jgi:NTE family protein